MLILSRRPGESLTIGDDVVVTVVGVSGNQIRLGITAPREVRVLREEVHKAMQEEKQAAANALDSDRRPGVLLDSCGDETEKVPRPITPERKESFVLTLRSEIFFPGGALGFASCYRYKLARFCPEDGSEPRSLRFALSTHQ